jgi:hypothetical protein
MKIKNENETDNYLQEVIKSITQWFVTWNYLTVTKYTLSVERFNECL